MNSESTYTVKGSRVTGNGWSYNLTSKVDAVKLCETLNNYETYMTLNQNINKQYDQLIRQIIQIKLSIGTLNEEVHQLEEQIQCLSK